MEAYKLNVQIAEHDTLSLKIPENFPRGQAEVIILARDEAPPKKAHAFQERLNRLEAAGRLTRPVDDRCELPLLAERPGALGRFLKERD